MAGRTTYKKPLGIVFDIFVFLLAVGAAVAFVPAYAMWTEDREYGAAEMECLRNLDSDCFLETYHSRWATARYSSSGRWMWTLRFMKTSGTLENRIDNLMRTPDGNMSRFNGNVIETWEVDRLISVGLSLLEFGKKEKAAQFLDAVLDKHEELYKGPLDYKPRYATIPSQTPVCSSGKLSDHTLDLVESAGQVMLTKMRRSACWFIYFSDKSDEEVKAFIDANLDMMEEQRLRQGKVVFEKTIYNLEEEMSYMDTMAFMAAILEFRKNPDKNFGMN